MAAAWRAWPPTFARCVPFKFRKNRTVHEALQENRWVSDIKNALGWLGLAEYLELWDLLAEVNLSDLEDVHRWKLEAS